MLNQLAKAVCLACLLAASSHAATIVGPSPYLAATDLPAGVFPADVEVHLEDFEDPDGPWEVCFSINNGQRIGPKHVSGDGIPVTDSVDADDTSIDGDGTMGSSWFTPANNLLITFDEPTVAAGFVFTDADSNAGSITIEAFAENGSSLLSQDFDASFLDDVFTGTTQEDRFFGITGMGGELIKSIQVSIASGTGIEIDHVQFVKGEIIPEPSSIALISLGLLGLVGSRRRRRRRRR